MLDRYIVESMYKETRMDLINNCKIDLSAVHVQKGASYYKEGTPNRENIYMIITEEILI
jgi:hypothetical protein